MSAGLIHTCIFVSSYRGFLVGFDFLCIVLFSDFVVFMYITGDQDKRVVYIQIPKLLWVVYIQIPKQSYKPNSNESRFENDKFKCKKFIKLTICFIISNKKQHIISIVLLLNVRAQRSHTVSLVTKF
jgi:hypothetical protein